MPEKKKPVLEGEVVKKTERRRSSGNPFSHAFSMHIEKAGDEVKKSAWIATFESFSILVLGILFIAWPDFMIKAVAYIVGTIFIIKGGYEIINYFAEKGQNDFLNNGLLSGIICVLVGIVSLVMGPNIADVFRFILGVFIIYEALVRMNTALKLHSVGIGIWKAVLVLSLVVLVLGIFVALNNIATIIGWAMVVAGLIGLIGDIMFIQQVDSVVDKLTKTLDNKSTK